MYVRVLFLLPNIGVCSDGYHIGVKMVTSRRYIELECHGCGAIWDVYVRCEPDGEGGVEYTPISDDPTGATGSFECYECSEEGEVI